MDNDGGYGNIDRDDILAETEVTVQENSNAFETLPLTYKKKKSNEAGSVILSWEFVDIKKFTKSWHPDYLLGDKFQVCFERRKQQTDNSSTDEDA